MITNLACARPAFSEDIERHAIRNVSLLTAEDLIELLEFHHIFLISQDEFRLVFETKREMAKEATSDFAIQNLNSVKAISF